MPCFHELVESHGSVECQSSQDHQLLSCIGAVDIHCGIGFGVSQSLSFLQNVVVALTVIQHASQNESCWFRSGLLQVTGSDFRSAPE